MNRFIFCEFRRAGGSTSSMKCYFCDGGVRIAMRVGNNEIDK